MAGTDDRHRCAHCAKVVAGHNSKQKKHMARCASLPRGVRKVLDHAAVCESRAGVGRFSGANAAVYRKFRVTGWLVASCRACGGAVRDSPGGPACQCGLTRCTRSAQCRAVPCRA